MFMRASASASWTQSRRCVWTNKEDRHRYFAHAGRSQAPEMRFARSSLSSSRWRCSPFTPTCNDCAVTNLRPSSLRRSRLRRPRRPPLLDALFEYCQEICGLSLTMKIFLLCRSLSHCRSSARVRSSRPTPNVRLRSTARCNSASTPNIRRRKRNSSHSVRVSWTHERKRWPTRKPLPRKIGSAKHARPQRPERTAAPGAIGRSTADRFLQHFLHQARALRRLARDLGLRLRLATARSAIAQLAPV